MKMITRTNCFVFLSRSSHELSDHSVSGSGPLYSTSTACQRSLNVIRLPWSLSRNSGCFRSKCRIDERVYR